MHRKMEEAILAFCNDSMTVYLGKQYSKSDIQSKTRFAGLLESPVMPPHAAVDTVHYKIFLSGKSGVGKTSLAARLAGHNIPNMHYETTGTWKAFQCKSKKKMQ